MTLAEYLDQCCRRRWKWGVHDCTLFAADWVRTVTGVDPAAGWRGTYGSADECRDRLAMAGGLDAVVSRAMSGAGFIETRAPSCGDVGLIIAPTAADSMGMISAIRQHDLWVARGLRGIMAARFDVVKAWRVMP